MAQEETRTEEAEAATLAAERRAPRRTAAQMLTVGVIASVLGIIAGLAIHWFPPASSTQADKIDTLWDVLIIASVPVFVLVTTVIGFSVLNFRMRPGEEDLDGPPIHGNTRLEVIWTAIPATLIVGLVVYAYVVLRDIEKAPALAAGQKERVVRVFGEQFAWTFEYNEGGKKFRTTQLYLPAGQSVKFQIQSKDVIHDFWVPDFRMKIDAVPGITTSYRVTPKQDSIGIHQIVCAELCGLGHAFMRSTVQVMTPKGFSAWVRRTSAAANGGGQAGGGGQGGGGQTASTDAKAIFTNGKNATGATACGACHTLSEASTTGTTGPDLDQVLKGKPAAFIKQSIVQPDAQIAKGYAKGIMPPNYGSTLSPSDVDALVKFLSDATK
jgi:cytochrome c oxidase subunit 2